MKANPAGFTAVVVLHESAGDLPALLRSFAEHAIPHGGRLVVVDTASADDGIELAADAGAEVVQLGANPGFGVANNAGLERVRTDVSVLLNPDVVLLDHGLVRLAKLARERDRLLVPRLLNADGTVQRSAHPAPGRAGGLLPALVHPPLLPHAVRLRAEPWRAERPRTVGWAIAACLTARTETFRRLGPFDPAAFLFYEDMDLCLRARRAGIATELRPEIALRHSGAHSTGPAYDGEPHQQVARRRREVLGHVGGRALLLDDLAQALTFTTRAAGRAVLRRDSSRERAQLQALRAARRSPAPRP